MFLRTARPVLASSTAAVMVITLSLTVHTAPDASADPAGARAGSVRSAATVISAGAQHTCALTIATWVKCWGSNADGQLGQGHTNDIGTAPGQMGNALTPIALGEGRLPVAVSAGGAHTCALIHGGEVLCWGQNQAGQLGLGHTNAVGVAPGQMGNALTPVDLPSPAILVSAGNLSTCAVLDDGAVVCWGANNFGQLGQGHTDNVGVAPGQMGNALTPTELPLPATAVSTGIGSACALLHDATVRCWGWNSEGQLGQEHTNNIGTAPGQMGNALPAVDFGAGGQPATAVTVGNQFACALLQNATVRCWGRNAQGQLGQEHTDSVGTAPGQMGNALPAVDLGAGGRPAIAVSSFGSHACALLDNGTTKCWGWNSNGALGQGHTDNIGGAAGQMGDGLPAVQLGAPALAVAVGNRHTCALLENTTLKCWGLNGDGRLGQGHTDSVGAFPGHMAALQPVSLGLGAGAAVVAPLKPSGFAGSPAPARLLDTRPGQPTIDGQFAGGGPRPAGSTLQLQLIGRAGVPGNVSAVVLNLTATDAPTNGFVTAHACTAPRPTASNLNFRPGISIANTVIVEPDAAGLVCLYTNQQVDLIADVQGIIVSDSPYQGVAPARLLDTRPGQPTIDGQFAGGGIRPAGSTLAVTVIGRGGVPLNTSAVVLNLTATGAAENGFATTHPCDAPRPTASNLNFRPGSSIANTVTVRPDADGRICIYTSQAVHLVLDTQGAHGATSSHTPITPVRLLDTRPGEPTIDGRYSGQGIRRAGSTLRIELAGRAGIPASAAGLVLNLTATGAQANGFATVYLCEVARPTASNLNFRPGESIANTVITRISDRGDLCIYTHQNVHLVVDAQAIHPDPTVD